LIRRLTGSVVSGVMERPWDGRDEGGQNLPSGVYFARVAGEAGAVTARLVLLK